MFEVGISLHFCLGNDRHRNVTHARERQSNRTHRSRGTASSNKNGLLPFAGFRDVFVEFQDFSEVLPTEKLMV